MKNYLFLLMFIFFVSCTSNKLVTKAVENEDIFVMAVGSCNRTDLPNLLWDDILKTNPDVWVWGGDNIYADTDDMQQLKQMYDEQNQKTGYKALKESTKIIGTWDDHDYGLNDGGVEFHAKAESQEQFLDFMNVPKDSPRRGQKGIYTSHDYSTKNGTIKVIVLDTRYFRTPLTPDTETNKRVKPNAYGNGDMLGNAQWSWLEEVLSTSKSDFNVIISSIQFLSNEHGFETWGNFPHEVDKLKEIMNRTKPKGVMIVSGDRHISEFSKDTLKGIDYPLIDFTSSGLTHAYRGFTGEPNPYRVGEVVFTESFGVLRFNMKKNTVNFSIVGDGGTVLEALEQVYE